MDVLSEVLRIIRLTGGFFFISRYSKPWSLSSPPADELARIMETRAECISLFHIVLEGRCWFSFEGRKPFVVDKGTLVIFPHSNAHIMYSNKGIYSRPITTLLSFTEGDRLPEINYGGKGKVSVLLCGYMQCDQKFNPLIGALPDVLLVSTRDSALCKHAAEKDVSLFRNIIQRNSGDWVDKTLQFIYKEAISKSPGSSTMMIRLTELLFVEVLRKYMEKLPTENGGWLAGIKDPEIGQALRLLHARPEYKWNVNELAQAVGVSRSALGQRFTELVGEPPISYLTGWRMQLAKTLLLQPNLSISSIAKQVGYDSDVSFSRAFKRFKGEPPVSWRNHKLE
jgi:AraC family transcriptional regulator, alkane utilization regulator